MIDQIQDKTLKILVISLLVLGCSGDADKSKLKESKKFVHENPDCVEHIALWSAPEIAKKIGKDKKWVFKNYTVDLWDKPPSREEGNIVGKLRASSYAMIIEKLGDDFLVESPLNKVQGWLNNEHVKTISIKNKNTRALCK